MTGQQIILGDGRGNGRRLGFAGFGDPQGRPIMFFHGSPSSRLEAGMVEPVAHQHHIRLIAPDRPGFGLSDFQPGRKVLDWPEDVIALANELELDRFAIMGLSGGAPYAAACALKIPHRLRAVGLVSGTAPTDVPGVVDSMQRLNRCLHHIGRWAPRLFGVLSRPIVRAMKRDPDRFFARLFAGLPEPDQVVLARAEIRENLLNATLEAFRSGSRGATWENAIYARPWGFRLQDITKEVHLWHGELDVNVPPAMGHYLATAIPNCFARFYEDEGHISLFVNHMEEILLTLSSGDT